MPKAAILQEPPNNQSQLLLSQIEVSSTEAWLELKTDNLTLPADIDLIQNSELRKRITLTKQDTVLYVDSLLPNQQYIFQLIDNITALKSKQVQVTTMDTTSHDFTWQTFTFGAHSSSSLYDVTIINENDIWAVGQIYMNDSLGQPDLNLYNVVHWDGSKWEVKRIYVDYKGQPNLASLTGTFGVPSNDLIFTSGLPYLPTQNGWKLYHLWDLGVLNDDDGGVVRVWGSSVQNLYFAGREGTIVHYNGVNWTKIESGTKTIISDVWGITNPSTLESEVYCTVSSLFYEPGKNDKKILKITNINKVEELSWEVNRIVNTIWTNNSIVKYAGGDGLFVNKTGEWEEITLPTIYSKSHIRGTDLNNIVVVGSFGLVAHFNGIDWKIFEELSLSNGYYGASSQE